MGKPTITGKQLQKIWGLDVKSALYSEWGNFYGLIDEALFPAALTDKYGYICFLTINELVNTPGVKVGKRINVPKRISSLPNYVRVALDGEEQIVSESSFREGKALRALVNRYERDQKAREACIQHYGAQCYACKLDFSSKYGEELCGFIHVHHKIPLSLIKESYQVDPIKDLIPLCPNCHAVVHKFLPPLSIEELITRIESSGD